MPASAQNSLQNIAENAATTKQVEQAERDRIRRERASATQELDQQRKACYQKLSVTPCLNEARDSHNEKSRDLKRQEVSLNDAQRKRTAADRLRIIDERNSPQAQQALAERRGLALAASAKREQSQAFRKSRREAKDAAAASKPATTQGAPKPPRPSGKPRQQSSPKLSPEQRPGRAVKMAQSRQQAAEREKAAEMRRAEAVQREAKRKKPASAPLPIPD